VAGRKSLLFLKKKKQKNFIHMRPGRRESRLPMDEVFLLLFVHKKKILAATCLAFSGFPAGRSDAEKRYASRPPHSPAPAIPGAADRVAMPPVGAFLPSLKNNPLPSQKPLDLGSFNN
jgi:hypothetical protein